MRTSARHIILLLMAISYAIASYCQSSDVIVVYYRFHKGNTASVTTRYPGRKANYDTREYPINKVTIENTISDNLGNRYTVVAIEDSAFMYTYVESVELPNSILEIGDFAFYDCYKLTKCNLGKKSGQSIKRIGDYAFANSPIPNFYGQRVIEHVGTGAFLRCEYLEKLNDNILILDIGERAFSHCVRLKEAPLRSGLETIGKSAFEFCDSLLAITIPSSVKRIERNPFAYCVNLIEIEVDADNANYDSRNGCNAIIGKDARSGMLSLVSGCGTTVIQQDVQVIGENAFAGCVKLGKINIPTGVKKLQKGAFVACKTLEEITLPTSLEMCEDKEWEHWDDVFGDCDKLSMVILPKSMTFIKKDFFKNNKTLHSLYLPKTVTRIEADAFKKCTGLRLVAIPNSETSVHEQAFSGCDSLVIYTTNQSLSKLVKGGKKVETISENEMNYCYPYEHYYKICMHHWMEKTKYESMAQYQARINDMDTTSKELKRVEKEYVDFYVKKNPYRPQLGKYNADVEVFPIYERNYGTTYLYVPYAEWQDVKADWKKATIVNCEFHVVDNQVCLKSLVVQLPRERVYQTK